MSSRYDAPSRLTLHKIAGFGLFVVGALVAGLGWPRTVTACLDNPYASCTSGHPAAVWIGLGLVVVSLYPLAVLAVVQGVRLAADLAAHGDAATVGTESSDALAR